MFKKKPEEYKCIVLGYIKLTDFVEKYYSALTQTKKNNRYTELRRKMSEVPKYIKTKGGNATYLLEKEFCIWCHVDYIEES